jgi:lipopolysaccharide/colanic/teichoic acid biosynthesis glycosyltransferase
MNKTKRIFDIALASICIVLLSPVILLIVAAMKVLSPGPLLFRQARVLLSRETPE